MTLIPILVFGALAILLVVLFRRTRTASGNDQSAAYGGDAWTPIMWSDVNSDSPCHNGRAINSSKSAGPARPETRVGPMVLDFGAD
jgi:hypothetical protein